MHPLGIVFAFMAFGLVGGLGLFISINTAPGLVRSIRGSQVQAGSITFMYTGLLLFGIALIVAGGYATYKVIYG